MLPACGGAIPAAALYRRAVATVADPGERFGLPVNKPYRRRRGTDMVFWTRSWGRSRASTEDAVYVGSAIKSDRVSLHLLLGPGANTANLFSGYLTFDPMVSRPSHRIQECGKRFVYNLYRVNSHAKTADPFLEELGTAAQRTSRVHEKLRKGS